MDRNVILRMDCLAGLKTMPDCSVDIVVTSPPYNKQEKYGGENVKAIVYDNFIDAVPEKEYQDTQVAVLSELHRVLKPDGSVFYNHKNRFFKGEMYSPLEYILRTDFCIRQEIIWDRMITGNTRGWRFWQTDEKIYWLRKRGHKPTELPNNVASLGSVWRIRPEYGSNTGHPCAFPEELVARCLSTKTEHRGLVLDPYMGSGTTAVVAKQLGYDYIGFELSPAYIKIAETRINQTAVQLPLF